LTIKEKNFCIFQIYKKKIEKVDGLSNKYFGKKYRQDLFEEKNSSFK
jgi:hypothetical protein